MNEITIHGNVTATPDFRFSRGGVAVANFSVAVNRRRRNPATGGWGELPPVFHRVVVFHKLAENVAESIERGTTVTVTGQFVDNSYISQGEERLIRQTQLEASEVAVSLRHATATVTKNPRGTTGDHPAPTDPAHTEHPDYADRAEASVEEVAEHSTV